MNTIYKKATKKSLHDAKVDLIENMKSIGFGVLYELNFKEKVKEKGFEITNNFIMMDVCNPATASEILEKNIEMGYVLPCKVVIYEHDDEQFIGLMKPTVMVDLIDETYLDVAKTIEAEMKEAIDKSV